MKSENHTYEEINGALSCDPDAGKLFWNSRPRELFKSDRSFSTFKVLYEGQEALSCLNSHGYLHGKIFGKLYKAHRVVWFLQTGEWPEEVDHINGVKTDNRFGNLRAVSHIENCRNQKRPVSNKSGVVGVHWSARHSMWDAQIRENYTVVHLGRFPRFEDAVKARVEAEKRLGFHPNHGRAA